MIGERFNFEDVFFRDLTVCVLDTLEGQVKWINRFTSGDRYVQVPFYYSLTGDERFLLDSFSDDIVSENRFIELNTDIIPRGHLTMTSFNIKSDEFANPNVWLRMVVENEIEMRKVLSRVRAIPITVNYDLEILLSNEIDTFKCSQALMDTMWLYKFMYFEHNFMNIDAVILMPDNNSIQMSREKNLTSDNNIILKCSFTVETYYPSFRKDRVILDGYPRAYGDGMRDSNGFSMTGGFSSFFSNDTNQKKTDNSLDSSISSVTGGEPKKTTFESDSKFGESITTSSNNRNSKSNYTNTDSINKSNDFNGVTSAGSTSDTKISTTDKFYDNKSSTSINNPFGSEGVNNSAVPKRSRWFNNILKARERASMNITNPNQKDPNKKNDGNNSNK